MKLSCAPYYLVYVENENSPNFKHYTIESAIKEAKRLCKLTNKKTFVFIPYIAFEINEFTQTNFDTENHLPF
jgi:hypothetical protein